MASMGEMTALFPVKGPTFEFVRRFTDESVGYACAWMLWLNCVVVAAVEILAVTEIFRFQVGTKYLTEILKFPEGTTFGWKSTVKVAPPVWVIIFLLVELLLNLLPVKFFGRVEYVVGCSKIIFIVALIMINMILHARQTHDQPFWTWNAPWDYKSTNWTVKPLDTTNPEDPGVIFDGPLGTFTSLWTAIGTAVFSMSGWEIILLTAPENRDLMRNETMKLSSRKIALRVILLYSLAIFTVGLNVPYDEPGFRAITISRVSGGQNSPFVLAAIRERVPFLPHFINGFFIFSATTTGVNALYSASRLLHAIASLSKACKWSCKYTPRVVF